VTLSEVTLCGDWVQYKEEKCFKIIGESTQTNVEALNICRAQNLNFQDFSATLVTIQSLEEQEFLTNYLFKTKQVVENVWLNMKLNNSILQWNDNSSISYTNFGEGEPALEVGYDCIQMIAGKGVWSSEPCKKQNLVLCQKMQNWSFS